MQSVSRRVVTLFVSQEDLSLRHSAKLYYMVKYISITIRTITIITIDSEIDY
jgi:hypothetical protein